ncbi:MAG: hypothetical protein KGJ55_08030 [Gammaproteobacteria bacterium]|nr:hypothetical protein [Gammaproteobacteria bacterium]
MRADHRFESGGQHCAAGLFRPRGDAAPALGMAMAHGFVAVREQRLPAFLAHEAAAAPQATVKSYACGHFDIYLPPQFDAVVAGQQSFLRQHPRPAG